MTLQEPQPRNRQTLRQHRVEVWWQILFPLLVVIGLIFGGAYLVSNQTAGNVERLAQIATMMLVLPIVVIGLILLVVFTALIFGVTQVISWIPSRAFHLQDAIERFSQATVRLADMVVEPLIRIDSATGAFRQAINRDKTV